MTTRLDVPILAQPDDLTRGPTCLHAVYGYRGEPLLIVEPAPDDGKGSGT